ncbi:MAG: tetratricopeptide repeat protein, partial [Thermodesulfovibrionia bacterium]|nr:tetratricopeptide repeat protein [Thermodesulfovibrionia bacterium]
MIDMDLENKKKILENKCLPYFFFAIFGTLLFANSLNGEFLWDDKSYIVESQALRNVQNLWLIFQPDMFRSLSGDYVDITRPVMFASLLVDYQLWGLKPFGYHAVNIALHILSTCLVFALSLRLTGHKWISFAGAFFFLIHPVHTEVIDGITFREDLLVTVFYLLSFICFIRAVTSARTSGKAVQYLLSLLLYLLSLLSKEMAVTLPAMLFLYLMIFEGEDARIGKIVKLFTPFIAITILYLHWITSTYSSLPTPPSYPGQQLIYSLLNIPAMLTYYIRAFLLPMNLSPDPAFKVLTSLSDFKLFLSFLFIGVIFFITFKGRKKSPVLTFFIVWFFITLLPVLQIIPTFNIVAERFLYLPSVGLSIIAGISLRPFIRERMHLLILSVIIFSLSLLTIERNHIWRDANSLWSDALKKNAHSYVAKINIENDFFEKKQYARAEKGFLEIISRWPDQAEAYNNLSIIYLDDKRYAQAEAILNKGVNSGADAPEMHYQLALTYGEMRKYDKAVTEVKKALQMNPHLHVP